MQSKAQFIVAALPWWGHIRHSLQLSLNLLSVHHSLCITYLTIPQQLDSIQNYITEVKPSDNVSARFRLVAIKMSVEPATGKEATFSWAPDVDDDLAKGWSGVLAPLINGHEVPCAVQGMSEAWKVEVRLVLTDMCLTSLQPALKAVLSSLNPPGGIPLLVANPWPGYWYLDLWAPGGRIYGLWKMIEAKQAETGMAAEEIFEHMPPPPLDDRLMDLIGLPKVYAYETRTQTEAIPQNTPRGFAYMTRIAGMIDTSDGALFAIPAELSDGVKKPIVDDGRECLEVGPQYPDSFWRGEPGRWGQEDTALKEFLDRFKERSVIYISFGSLFWPVLRPDLMADLVETLLDSNFPFVMTIMSLGSGIGDLVDRVKSSKIGMVVKKAPQIALLQHSSVGFCLTHGGISTLFECVLTEIPTVMFPLEGDQPHTALFASERGIAIELMQVRTGMGVGLPTMRGITPTDDKATRREEMTDVWTRIRGEEGEVMRGKVREMKEVVVESWRQGESYRAMRSFAKWIESADNS